MPKTPKTLTLEEWRLDAGLTYERLGEKLGVTHAAARRYCLPPKHKDHRYPGTPELRRKIRELTDGQVVFD